MESLIKIFVLTGFLTSLFFLFIVTVLNQPTEKYVKSTNNDKPFEQGEFISFADEIYVVVVNKGNYGFVNKYGLDSLPFIFFWYSNGEECVRADPKQLINNHPKNKR